MEGQRFKEFFNLYGIKFLISFVLSLAIFLVIFLTGNMILLSAVDGLFYAFTFSFVIGVFSFVTNLGFFDIFAYNWLRFKGYITNYKNKENEFNGTYEYTKSKELKRKNTRLCCLSYFASSFIFLVPCVITYIIFKVSI